MALMKKLKMSKLKKLRKLWLVVLKLKKLLKLLKFKKENFDHLSLQDLNNEEVKTLTKHVFKEFFNSFLHLAAEISSDANEEPSEDRLNIFTEETFNAKPKKLEEKLN